MIDEKRFCPTCGWVDVNYWNGSGFMQALCSECEQVLDNDPLGWVELENSLYEEDEND